MNDNINDENKNSNKTMDLLKSKLSNFMIIIIIIFVIVVIFLVFSYLGKSNNQNSSTPILNSINNGVSSTTELLTNSITSSSSNSENTNSKSILGIIFGIIYFILFIIIIVLLVQYFFKVDITQPIKNMFIYKTSQKPEHELDVIPDKIIGDEEDADLDAEPTFLKNNKKKEDDDDTDDDDNASKNNNMTNKVKSFSPKLQFKEVYHIPGNHYSYEESKSVCKALGGELANIKQMEDVYKKGGEWCSYGWSNNQMALFPTQHDHWNKLQTIKGHENDCGRPGINGGYIANPNVKFGVNCYGYRPKMKPIESKLMESAEEYPITEQQIAFNKQVDHWKKRINEIIIAPFNAKNWSESGL
jgi:hypothetical protein